MNWDLHTVYKTLIYSSVVFLFACKKDKAGCMDMRGDLTEKTIILDAFSYIHLSDRMSISFVEDSSDYAVITAGDNVIDGIQVKQSGQQIAISEINTCNWIRKIDPLPHVEIHFTEMAHIYSENSGRIGFMTPFTRDSLLVEVMDVSGSITLNVACQDLNIVVHTGATDVYVEGTCNYAYIYNSGYAPIKAQDLKAKTVSVHNNSLGDTYVNAFETLYYQIYHQGNVHASGEAEIIKWHQSGGGQIIRE
ncbi:MAG: DUF2807 domain-containing protein [Salibacteraceae bacterium]